MAQQSFEKYVFAATAPVPRTVASINPVEILRQWVRTRVTIDRSSVVIHRL